MENKSGFMFIRTTEAGSFQRHLVNDSTNLTEVMEEFQYFLKGCGYVFDGDLEIVENEEE